MKALDYQYISSLLPEAADGNSNAFAELYAATYQKQYAFAMSLLNDRFSAEDVLQELYVYALTNIAQITEGTLFVPWLCQTNLRICLRMLEQRKNSNADPEARTFKIKGNEYTVRKALRLPVSQSQAVLFKYFCGLKTALCASYTEIGRAEFRHACRRGVRSLVKGGEGV